MITVAVVDDDRMLLDGLTSWLSGAAQLRLVAAVSTVDALLDPARGAQPSPVPPPHAQSPHAQAPHAQSPHAQSPHAQSPHAPPTRAASPPADVVLLDLLLKDGSEPAANIRRLRAVGSRVLIISTATDRAGVVDAVAAGADGYLTKDNDLDTLVDAVATVAAGGTAHSPELAFAWAHDTGRHRPRLSPKELEVLRHYASGLTLKATARRAGISPHTAKHHLDRVKDKYQRAGRPAYTKIDLAVRVREDGLGSDTR
ncbi:response regulator transcription factor [Streptomyces poriticola]|uniref:response regulator transcription factor n=1 Tax=Streptomyces poriticola TaxID=3120506 RepID=UPI002FCE12F0